MTRTVVDYVKDKQLILDKFPELSTSSQHRIVKVPPVLPSKILQLNLFMFYVPSRFMVNIIKLPYSVHLLSLIHI